MLEMCGKIHFQTNQNTVERMFNCSINLNPVNFWIELECFVSIIQTIGKIIIWRSGQKDYGICQTHLQVGVGEVIGQSPDSLKVYFVQA